MTFKNWLRQLFGFRLQASHAARHVKSRQAARLRCVPQVESLDERLAPATLIVNSVADNVTSGNNLLTLREAIRSINQGSLTDTTAAGQVTGSFGSNDTIQFASNLDGQNLILTAVDSGDAGQSAFPISKSLVIDGETGISQGINLTRSSTSGPFRFFFITPTGSLTLKGMTLSGGEARGFNGGGGNGAAGGGAAGMGGAIYNQGALTLLNSTLTGNTAQGGAGGSPSYGSFDAARPGNGGGGLNRGGSTGYNTDGGPGGGPNGGSGAVVGHINGYAGGFGGGGGGGFGLYVLTVQVGVGGQGGFGAGGGGGGSDQFSGKYRGNNGGNSEFGGGGGGAGKETRFRDTVVPGVSGYGGGSGYKRSGGGGAGMGGAVFNQAGTVVITNSTLVGNVAAGGAGGTTVYVNDAQPGKALGGALFNYNGTVTSNNSTLAGNAAGNGGRGIFNLRSGATPARLVLNNTLIGQSDTGVSDLQIHVINSTVDDPAAVSGANNLIRTITGTNSLTGTVSVDPMLGPLQDNGGRTATIAFAEDSPANDAGILGATYTDQRGVTRGGRPDIGAYELHKGFNITVNTAADETNNPSTLSLREAIALADDMIELSALSPEEQLQVSVATGFASTISFANSLSGNTITLTTVGDTSVGSSALSVHSPITINGITGNSGLTLSTTGTAMRHFYVANGGNLTLRNLTLQGGNSQGLTGNAGQGGAIFNRGALSVLNSTLTGNTARGGAGADGKGGAIFNDTGTVLVSSSTLTGNTATGNTSGQGLGGGVFNNNGTLTVRNSTLSLNTVVQGNGSTLIAAGRDIYNQASIPFGVEITSSILGQADTLIEDFSGLVGGPGVHYASGSYNLIRRMSGFSDTVVTADPMLGVLQSNGGPTQTMALVGSSPAIDAGSIYTDTTDQRGVPRPYYSVDIGAFERTSLRYVVNTTADETTNDSTLSLREAIDLANGTIDVSSLSPAELAQVFGAPTDTITFDSSLGGSTLTLSNVGDTSLGASAFLIASAVTIEGLGGDDGITLSAAGTTMRLFRVTSGGSLTLENLTLTGGTAQGSTSSGRGGAIHNQGTLRVLNSTLTGNIARGDTGWDGRGGAIFNESSAAVRITNSTFTGNTAQGIGTTGKGLGGAIYNYNGQIQITHSTFSGDSVIQGNGSTLFTAGREIYSLDDSLVLNTSVQMDVSIVGQADTSVSEAVGVGGTDFPMLRGFKSLIRNPTFAVPADSIWLNSSVPDGDPRLDTLKDNGGPTATMALLPGSPAIDQVNFVVAGVTTDQRGINRLLPADVGTFELRPTYSMVVTTQVDEAVDSDNTTLSLREAINLANGTLAFASLSSQEQALATPATSFASTISFATILNGQTITLTAVGDQIFGPSGLLVNSRIIINGSSGGNGVTLSAAGTTMRPFRVASSGNLTLQNLTVSGGTAQGFAGADAANGNAGGGAAGLGGAIYNQGTLTILNSTLTGNTARGGSGGSLNSSLTGVGGAGGGGLGGPGSPPFPASDTLHPGWGGGGGGTFPYFGGGGGIDVGNYHNGRNAGFGGGGGGGLGGGPYGGSGSGGAGGFGGGGGGGGFNVSNGGAGGFGGGGGAASGYGFIPGGGGFGGGRGGAEGGGGGGGAGLGGAVFNQAGTVVITNSTFTLNTAIGGAGGAGDLTAGGAGQGVGGGVFNFNGTLTLSNSTLSGNTADSGRGLAVISDGADVTSSAEINNTIIGQGDTTKSDLTIAQFNIGVDQSGSARVTGTTNLIRTISNSANNLLTGTLSDDPQLGGLASNGGPTRTLALPLGSVAINAGTAPGAPGTDQRGTARLGNPDIGAFEFDKEVSLAVSPATVVESSGTGMVYTFTRSGDQSQAATVNFGYDGTATLTDDYTVTSSDPSFTFGGGVGTVSFASGVATATITLTPVDDAVVEPAMTIGLTVTAVAGYGIGTLATATGTITNDDTDVRVEVLPASVAEDGAANLVYTFTRTGVTAGSLTVSFDVSGTAAFGTDFTQSGTTNFTSTTGNVTFAAGASTATITLNPATDTTVEFDETAVLTLTTGTGYNATGTAATGTIRNDDVDVSVAVTPGVVVEDGTTNLVYTFTRTGYTAGPLTVSFDVSGAATFGTDFTQTDAASFTATAGTVTFADDELTTTVTITPSTDTIDEPDEDVILTVTDSTGYTALAPTVATGTITDDDAPPAFTISNVAVNEADGNASFTVTRNGATAFATSVDYATSNDTATSASNDPGTPDFTADANTLSFPASTGTADTQTIIVPITNDLVFEGSEQFFVNLTNATVGKATISDAQGIGTINDNDTAPTLSIDDPIVNENGTATFTVTLTGATSFPISVGYATADNSAVSTGSATPGTPDFTSTSDTLNFPASTSGTQTLTINVPITADTVDEIDEQLFVNLSGATNGSTIGDSQGVGTITDDDAAPTISVDSPSVSEGVSGTTNLTFTVTLSAASAKTVTVNYATGDVNATAPSDYTALPSTLLTFLPGETSKQVTVLVNGDNATEPDETLTLDLSGATNAAIATLTGTGTILNDDIPPDTAIGTKPAAVTASTSATFSFTGSNNFAPGVLTFEASLDGGAFAPVTSPLTIPGLTEGSHTFEVRAVNSYGNFDLTPALYTWIVDTAAPTAAFGSPTATLTASGPVSYTLTVNDLSFNESSLTAGDFTLNKTGNANGTIQISGSGNSRTVTIINITGNGTLGVTLKANSISDALNNKNALAVVATPFNVDNTKPAVSISAPSAPSTSTGDVTYTITYSDTNLGAITLAPGDVTLNATGTATGTVQVSGSGNTRTVTITGVSGDGTLGISLAANTASDAAGNTSLAAGPSGTFVVDNSAPLVSIGAPAVVNGVLTFTVTYTDPTLATITLAPGDVTLNTTGTANGTAQVSGTGNSRTVSITNLSGDGMLGISIAANTATDGFGRPAPAAGPSATFEVKPTVRYDMKASVSAQAVEGWNKAWQGTKYNATTGYGWSQSSSVGGGTNGLVPSGENTAVMGDYAYGVTTATFQVFVGANQFATVKIYSYGTAAQGKPGVAAKIGNGPTSTLTTNGVLTISGTAGADGILNITFSRRTGTSMWVVSALEVNVALVPV